MKTIPFLLAALLAAPSAFASNANDIDLLCRAGVSLEQCADKVEAALGRLGCAVDTSKTDCDFGLIQDPNSSDIDARIQSDIPVCRAISTNCSEPIEGAWSESCPGSTKMVQIPRREGMDRGFGYGISAKLFGYSRNICLKK